jgi:SAM-dependent methyltransferase
MTQDPSDEVPGPGLRIARHYASEAEAYRDLWAPVLVRLARWLTDEIPIRDARRILDLGCGVGALLSHLRDASPEAMVVGLDRTQAMVALGPRAFPLLVGDAVQLPFRDRSFDAVVTTFMLFHLPDPTAGLAEARRVLRPGGWIGLLTWGSERDTARPGGDRPGRRSSRPRRRTRSPRPESCREGRPGTQGVRPADRPASKWYAPFGCSATWRYMSLTLVSSSIASTVAMPVLPLV